MSTLPTLGPTLPVIESRVLKISNEPNLHVDISNSLKVSRDTNVGLVDTL